MGIFSWIDQIEMHHILYLGTMCASLLIIGFIGQSFLVPILIQSATPEAGRIISTFHEWVLLLGFAFFILSVGAGILLFEVS